MVIYKIQNRTDGKVYIGQTKHSIHKRIKEHLIGSTYLSRVLRKYTLEYFDASVIDSAETKKESDEKEKYWIKFYDCKAPNGYNLTDGGDGFIGGKHSKESKKRISEKNKLIIHTEEWTKKVVEARKNNGSYKHNDVAKKKMSKSHKGLVPFNKGKKLEEIVGSKERAEEIKKHHNDSIRGKITWIAGKHHNEETRKKISDKLKGKSTWNKGLHLSEEHKRKVSVSLRRYNDSK